MLNADQIPKNQTLEPPSSTTSVLLYRFRITKNYKIFRNAAYATVLASMVYERFPLVTSTFVLMLSDGFGTTWPAVERNLRIVITIAQ